MKGVGAKLGEGMWAIDFGQLTFDQMTLSVIVFFRGFKQTLFHWQSWMVIAVEVCVIVNIHETSYDKIEIETISACSL